MNNLPFYKFDCHFSHSFAHCGNTAIICQIDSYLVPTLLCNEYWFTVVYLYSISYALYLSLKIVYSLFYVSQIKQKYVKVTNDVEIDEIKKAELIVLSVKKNVWIVT